VALSRRDEVLDRSIQSLIEFLERRPGREATRREIQRAQVGGLRAPNELDALLTRYEAIYPGTVTTVKPPQGRLQTVVRAPRRRRAGSRVCAETSGNPTFPRRTGSQAADSAFRSQNDEPEPVESLPDVSPPDGSRP
jgi:hypothetical protein